jgi:hypothetical protein
MAESTYCTCKTCDLLAAARKSFLFHGTLPVLGTFRGWLSHWRSSREPTVFLKFSVTSGKRNFANNWPPKYDEESLILASSSVHSHNVGTPAVSHG